MTDSPNTDPTLFTDPQLWEIWMSHGLPQPLALASAHNDEMCCVVVVLGSDIDPGEAALSRAHDALASHWNLPTRVFTTGGPAQRTIVRDWLYQAAQGSGRGVELQLHTEETNSLTVLVRSIDSSAREVAMRLGALGGSTSVESRALARLLNVASVTIRDVEGP